MPGDNAPIWQLFVKGFKGKTLSFQIKKFASVMTLLEMIGKEVGLDINQFYVLYASKQLDVNTADDKDLEDYDIHNLGTLVLVTRVIGGHNLKPIPKRSTFESKIPKSPESCIISEEDSDEAERVKMPCGHAIVPEELKNFCRQKMKKGQFTFQCPAKMEKKDYCKRLWTYGTIRRYAFLDEDEMKEFEVKLSLNSIRYDFGECVECPGCKSYCIRENIKDVRVECPHCTNSNFSGAYYFCWHCLGEWRNSANDYCGNEGCSVADPRLNFLQDCSSVKVLNGQKYVSCPSVRACINCGSLVHFQGGCKRIPCSHCNFEFCFVCLRPFTGKKRAGECGYGVICKNVAPRQECIVTRYQ